MQSSSERVTFSRKSIAAVGDVTDPGCWSGIPFHFWRAAHAPGFAEIPWRLDLKQIRGLRYYWNACRLLHGLKVGGFQYSKEFFDYACAAVPLAYLRTEIISFHQHFPPHVQVTAGGGSLNHYLDATFAALTSNRGLNLRLPPDVVARGREQENANYAASQRVITMARWAARSVIEDCGVDAAKVSTILPGANFDLPAGDESLPEVTAPGRAGRERQFVLGFVGMDWKRKGLEFLVSVRDNLAKRGYRTLIMAAGNAPRDLRERRGVQFVGRIDKYNDQVAFLRFLTACDLGCLFSTNESLGISTLEFLRAGVPVAGFAHQGLEDTLPPDAGFRFPLGTSSAEVVDVFEAYLRDEAQQASFRRNARAWSPLMTWERCVAEMQELWQTGEVRAPVRLWLGLPVESCPAG
jgi:glycosyltransferase involved in cell wall biosynthesis